MVGVCGEKSSRRPGPKGGLAPEEEEEEEEIPGPIKCAPFNATRLRVYMQVEQNWGQSLFYVYSLRSIRKLDAVLLAKTNGIGGHCMGENNRTFENRNCMQAQFLLVDRPSEQILLAGLH
jgi:hypothetical protein